MSFSGKKITEYKDGRDSTTGTLARGSTFNNEFNRLYADANYLKNKTDDLQGQINNLIDGAPEALNTLSELSAALNNDAELATTLLSKIEASGQQNLVYNHDFRLFSNQSGAISSWYDYQHPDGWIFSDNGTDGKVGYDTVLECCKIQTSSDGSGSRILKQSLHEFVNWKNLLLGKTVTLKAFVKGGALLKLSDGVSVTSCVLQNTGAIEEVELQIETGLFVTELTFSIESETAANIIEIYKVYANKGNHAIETLPCIIQGHIGEIKTYNATEIAPAGEFELNGIELPAGYTRLDSFLNGKLGRGNNGRSKLIDGRGMFERQWAHGSDNDPDRAGRTNRGDGVNGDRVGTRQGDAIRNITGDWTAYELAASHNSKVLASGALYHKSGCVYGGASGNADLSPIIGLDASRIVPVGLDNRPKNYGVFKTIRWC